MFSKLSGRTKTQGIKKNAGKQKKMEENDAKIKSLSVENIALQELKNKADKQAEQLNRLIQS